MYNNARMFNIRLIRFLLLFVFLLNTWLLSPSIVTYANYKYIEQAIVFSKLEKNPLLDNNPVYTIVQDSYGYMWFGGRAGLFKYDGIKVKRVDITYNSTIRALFEDSYGKLWIGTENGLYAYDYKTKKINSYHHTENLGSISSESIWSICEDKNGTLWIGTNEGLNSYEREKNSFVVYINNPNDITTISDNMIRVLYKDSRDILWIGTNNGINIQGKNYGEFIRYTDKLVINGDNTIWDIYEDRNGILWIGTNEGLYSFNLDTEIIIRYSNSPDDASSISSDIVYSIYEDNMGTFWVGTNDGLNSFDKTTGAFTSNINIEGNPDSIGNNVIRKVYKGSQDILWIGTRTGVYYVDPQKQHFSYYNEVIKDIGIRAIDILGDVSILGTSTDVIMFNYKNNEIELYINLYSIRAIRNAIVECVYIDQKGILWVGTDHIGLLKIDISNGEYEVYSNDKSNPNSIIDGWITSLCYSIEQELLWIGTNKGLCSFNYEDNIFKRYEHDSLDTTSISSNNITVVYCSEDGNIWIGSDQGLDRFDYDTGEFIHYLKSPVNQTEFITGQVESIYEDSTNRLWIATTNGLFLYEVQTDNYKLYTQDNGLPQNHVLGIIEDDDGNMWLTTSHSLTKLSPESSDIINYGHDDGLRGNINYRNSIEKNEEGAIFIGTTNGIFSFFPEQIGMQDYYPPLLIKDFYLVSGKTMYFTQPVEQLDQITLQYADNSFIIDFVALDYSSQLDNKYAYILEGFDSTWQYCDPEDSIAKYTNIPNGEYNFIVKASNSDGAWNTEVKSLKIFIKPPYWQEWWFILISIALISIVVVEIIKFRTRVLRMHAQNLENQVEERTSRLELKSQKLENELEQRVFFSRALIHELKTPLTAVLAASSLLSTELKDEPHKSLSKRLNESAYDLDGRINELFDLSKGELGLLQIERKPTDIIQLLKNVIEIVNHEAQKKNQNILLLNESLSLPLIEIDESRIRQVVFNLLDNAIKFTPEDGCITISVEKNAFDIIIKIKDTGIGMKQAELSNIFNSYHSKEKRKGNLSGLGLGLSLSKMFIELHGGHIWAESEEKNGSTFFFSIPFSV